MLFQDRWGPRNCWPLPQLLHSQPWAPWGTLTALLTLDSSGPSWCVSSLHPQDDPKGCCPRSSHGIAHPWGWLGSENGWRQTAKPSSCFPRPLSLTTHGSLQGTLVAVRHLYQQARRWSSPFDRSQECLSGRSQRLSQNTAPAVSRTRWGPSRSLSPPTRKVLQSTHKGAEAQRG